MFNIKVYRSLDLNRHLLTDTTTATPATNSRISTRLRSLQERLKKLEEQTETHSPPAQTAASRTAASYTATAIESSYVRFRMYSTMKQSKYMRSEQNAIWAYRVIVSQDRPVVSIGWLEQHWDSIPNETAPLWREFATLIFGGCKVPRGAFRETLLNRLLDLWPFSFSRVRRGWDVLPRKVGGFWQGFGRQARVR